MRSAQACFWQGLLLPGHKPARACRLAEHVLGPDLDMRSAALTEGAARRAQAVARRAAAEAALVQANRRARHDHLALTEATAKADNVRL